MVDPINDIAAQARQGSVSAIIQILNDKLADSGVRTRAMFSDGVLQLLCEAATPQQMPQTTLVRRIKDILESLQPKGIRRISVNSRIVREQQLLWLDEINRDPESQLLWSEEIKLVTPGSLKRWIDDWKLSRSNGSRIAKPISSRERREKRQFWRGILQGASLSLFLLLVGWAIATWLGLGFGTTKTQSAATGESVTGESVTGESVTDERVIPAGTSAVPDPSRSATTVPSQPAAPVAPPAPVGETPVNPVVTNAAAPEATPLSDEPFVVAVRLAESAVADGKVATTPAQWLDIASRWQQAADLMAQVQPSHERYAIAQDRSKLYSDRSQEAQENAAELRQ
jgi:hypothetical protein